MALLPPLAGAPRTASSDRRRTKPQRPCTQGLRSASVSYRVPLAEAALHNPTAPAHSCRPARPPTPFTSPRFKKARIKGQDAPPPSQSLSSTRHRVPVRGIFPRYPAWACTAVSSARDERHYPPVGRLALLRQGLRDSHRTRRRWF